MKLLAMPNSGFQLLPLPLLLAGALATPSGASTPQTTDTLVATIPKGFAFVHMEERAGSEPKQVYLRYAFAPGGKRVAFYAAKKDRVYGFLDGEKLGYASKGAEPVFSEDGEHVVMALGKVNKNRSESWKIFVDGDEATKEDWVGALSISASGDSIAYWTKPDYRVDPTGKAILSRAQLVLARRKKKRFRRTVSEEYSWALTYTAPLMDEAGTKAFGTAYDDRRRGLVVAVGDVEDEILSAREGYIRQYAITKDASRVATVRRLYKENKRGYEKPETVTFPRFQLEVDGEDLRVNADATALPRFSENGEHYSFVYLRDGTFGIGLDGELLPVSEHMILKTWPDSTGGRVAWVEHRDGELLQDRWLGAYAINSMYQGKSHLAYGWVAEDDGELILDEVEFSEGYDKIFRIIPSPNEERLAFLGMEETAYYVVCGTQRMGPFESVDRIEWTDDTTLAAGTRDGSEFYWREMVIE